MFIFLKPEPLHKWLEQKLVHEKLILKEFDIIQAWRSESWLPDDCFASSLCLFRTHFFIFHQLYYFNKDLLNRKTGWLEIHTLHIEFKPGLFSFDKKSDHHQAIDHIDPLLEYYMDWRPLFETSEKQVQQLMAFAYAGFQQPYQLQAAFEKFELTSPTTAIAVKQAYRKLASKHHPDKGGVLAEIQQINQYKELLLRWLKCLEVA